jgi:uncharacterized membrane protein YeiB
MLQRIDGFDLARAVAMLVMVLVNFKVAMLTGTVTDSDFGLDLLDGRAAAVFVTLAGIGLSLLSAKARQQGAVELQQQARRQVLRRAAFLFLVGLAFITVWPADILHYYGVMLALASLLLFWPGIVLLGLAFLVMLAFPFALWLGFDYNAGWHWQTLTYSDFWRWPGFQRNLWLNGFHPLLPWFSFLLLGLWLGRLNWQSSAVQWRLLLSGAGFCLLAEALQRFGTGASWSVWLGQTSPMPPLPLFVCSAAGSTLIWLVLAVKIANAGAGQPLVQHLEHLGRLALTLYLTHILLGLGILDALGLLQQASLPLAVGSACAYLILFGIFSVWHRRYFQHGPVEWCLRKVAGATRSA